MTISSMVSRARAIVGRSIATLSLSAVLAGASHAGVVLVTERLPGTSIDILLGAKNVDVGGVLYDVAFVDGTCVALFSGCDSAGDFVFTTQAQAVAASIALLDQVFTGVFDSSPWLTAGCSDPSVCVAFTPYQLLETPLGDLRVLAWLAFNVDPAPPGDFTSGPAETNRLAVFIEGGTYAVWSRASAVPEPSTLALLGAAGVALVWSQRRRTVLVAGRAQQSTPARLAPAPPAQHAAIRKRRHPRVPLLISAARQADATVSRVSQACAA